MQLIREKGAAREWQRKLQKCFVQSHWLILYPQGDRFMKRSDGAHGVCWWSSYYAGVDAYYQSTEGQTRLQQPLPGWHTDHYPAEGWKLAATATQYILYDIEAKHDLFDLSESEIYDRVS